MALTKLNVARALTGATPVANGGTALTSGFVNGGGLTEADTWRVTTNFQGDVTPIASNWERDDTALNGLIGTGMSQSSGIFTFPNTGYYLVTFNMCYSSGGTDNNYILKLS